MKITRVISALKRLARSFRFFPEVSSLALLIIAWHFVSKTVPSFLLPSPLLTFQETYKTLFSPDFLSNAFLTLKRAFNGFAVAFVVAHILVLSSIYFAALKKFWSPLILIGLSIPATIGVFVTIVMLGSRGPIALIVVIIILTPLMYLMLYPAFQNINKGLTEMAKVYRFRRSVFLRYVIVPQLAPYYLSAIRAGVNDSWKLAILAEVFSFGDGVGHRILQYFNLFSIRQVLAWFISFLIILVIIEYGVFQNLERFLVPKPRKA